MALATAIVAVLLGYLTLGLGFGIWFAWRGAGTLDPVAAAGSPGFRLLIVPGGALLWPLLVARIRAARAASGR